MHLLTGLVRKAVRTLSARARSICINVYTMYSSLELPHGSTVLIVVQQTVRVQVEVLLTVCTVNTVI